MGASYTREQFALKLGADGDPKLNAAADFAARLLNGPAGEGVARIVLFGSVARGEAGPQSDVDLLVLGAGSLATLARASTHAAAETVIERGETLTPLVYGASQLVFPWSHLVWSALREGREMYAMDEAALRREMARGLLRKARRLLGQAAESLKDRGYELAIAGGYTAAEHAAKGLLMLKPAVKMPGSHGGVAQMFGREYVRTGEAPVEWSDLLQQKLELRSRAMYDYQMDPAPEEAAQTLEFAGELIGFLRQKLGEAQPDEIAPGEQT